MEEERTVLPFTAFINQELGKLALILPTINPNLSGVLLKGEKGTGKSVLVRALAGVAPPYEYVEGCRFHCNPDNPTFMCEKCRTKYNEGEIKRATTKMQVVDLPLGATEDMITGALNVEKALRKGIKAFQPGLLAKANRNILYIDEINLLPDHLVDLILDAAAMGWNYVEREGLSVTHPANFVLIGSMNPEEGGLRPQLLDRFALSGNVSNIRDKSEREDVIQRNLAFKENSVRFTSAYERMQGELKKKIVDSRKLLDDVTIPEPLTYAVVMICKILKVDGHRPDIVLANTARTIAAYQGRILVKVKDIALASNLVFGHRTRGKGKLAPPKREEIRKAIHKTMESLQEGKNVGSFKEETENIEKVGPKVSKEEQRRFEWAFEPFKEEEAKEDKKKEEKTRKKGKPGGVFNVMKKKIVKSFQQVSDVIGNVRQKLSTFWKESLSNKMIETKKEKEGQTVPLHEISLQDYSISGEGRKSELPEMMGRVSLPSRQRLPFIKGVRGFSSGRRAPVKSKASQGKVVGYEKPKGPIVNIAFGPTIRAAALRTGKRKFNVRYEDIRVKVRQHRAKAVFALVFDTSKSMWAYLSRVTKALLKFHEYAWRSKDKIGVIEARGDDARVLLEPTSNKSKIKGAFFKIREGGKTPLASALLKSYEMLILEKRKTPDIVPICIVVSDGLGNVELKKVESKELREKVVFPSQADILAVARRFSLKNVPILVLNPMHLDKWAYQSVLSPSKILKEIARMTNGKYVGFRHREFFRRKITAETIFDVLRESLQTLLQSRIT
ncbi:MAG: hypothetical protein GWN31_06695 [Candidatus Thorarchaeota archaeon]|nr:hypothetical protein [Candidatus Thorarchaeota archaeon]NIW13611.1 hypothetical protein [Candidatus Thorarchaeota archaeon]NIW51707.1 hypothetical protein [Candidatus Korarchaeota archaeon]